MKNGIAYVRKLCTLKTELSLCHKRVDLLR